jgi:hypothetical protein
MESHLDNFNSLGWAAIVAVLFIASLIVYGRQNTTIEQQHNRIVQLESGCPK